MLGAIAGDVIGSVYEHQVVKTTRFPLFSRSSTFTDDTVLTVATAQAILSGTGYADQFKELARRYPDAGYGGLFYRWMLSDEPAPYNSWGNGSAMRVSPVGFAFDSIEDVLVEAKKNAEVTHNHPEGIKGAEATALAVFLARTGRSKAEIKEVISARFGYNLDKTIDEIRPLYTFDPSCQGTVPEAVIAFLESVDFDSAVRLAISLGGDSDTLACIAGGIGQAFYKEIPPEIVSGVRERLPDEFLSIMDEFNSRYGLQG